MCPGGLDQLTFLFVLLVLNFGAKYFARSYVLALGESYSELVRLSPFDLSEARNVLLSVPHNIVSA